MSPDVLAYLEKLGVPGGIVVIVWLALWTWPTIRHSMRTKTAQTQAMTESLPRIEGHLAKMADAGQASTILLQQIRDTQNYHTQKLDKLIERKGRNAS